jgi:hypothetical protein
MLSYLWGGSDFVKNEKEDPIEALKEDLSEHGEFELNYDKTMQFIDFLNFRSCIVR